MIHTGEVQGVCCRYKKLYFWNILCTLEIDLKDILDLYLVLFYCLYIQWPLGMLKYKNEQVVICRPHKLNDMYWE